jgi:hypothetical protein
MSRCWNVVGAPLLRALDAQVVAWLTPDRVPDELFSGGVRRLHLLATGSHHEAHGQPEIVVHDGTFDGHAEQERLDLAVLSVDENLIANVGAIAGSNTSPALRPFVVLAGLGSTSNGGRDMRGQLRRFCARSSRDWELIELPGEAVGILALRDQLDANSGHANAEIARLIAPAFVRRRLVRLEAESAAARSELELVREQLDDGRRHIERADRAALASERRAAELSGALDDSVRSHTRLLERATRLDAETSDLRKQSADLRAELSAAEARLNASDLRRADAVARLRRIETSRAWRWGHRVTRLLRIATFRKPGHTDGVRDAIRRLEDAPPTRR